MHSAEHIKLVSQTLRYAVQHSTGHIVIGHYHLTFILYQ
jgi:hypothetical protein